MSPPRARLGTRRGCRRSGFTRRTIRYFGPALSRRLVEAYRAGGAEAEYHLLPALDGDGHDLIYARDGVPLWKPVLEQFFRNVR